MSSLDKQEDDAAHDQPLLTDETEHASDDDLELGELDANGSLSASYTQKPQVFKSSVPTIWVALALIVTVVGFTINTEATVYLEDRLGWKKPFAAFYVTHSTLALPWLCHVGWLRWRARRVPYMRWVQDYNNQLRAAIASNETFATSGAKVLWFKRKGNYGGPLDFLATTMAMLTVVLTVSGLSWFVSLSMTTPADLTAIYNCSTFFAAVLSVPLLKERLGRISVFAVGLSLAGTFIIAYGDTTSDHENVAIGAYRVLGNTVATVGACAFGLYEVLFKKWASASPAESQESSLPLSLAASALTGFFTLVSVWPGFIILNFTGVETFELPSLYASLWMVISVLTGAVSVTSLVVLVVWTDPVFGSMANVLTVFTVALADWLLWGSIPSVATYIGGALIIVAFGMLAKDTLGR